MNDLGSKAPLRLHLRHAFHDWMWSGGDASEVSWVRRLCRRLPNYFADPYMDGLPKSTVTRRTIVLPSPGVLVDFTTGKIMPMPQTYAASSGRTFTYKVDLS